MGASPDMPVTIAALAERLDRIEGLLADAASPWLTIEQAAAYAKRGRTTIEAWIRRGLAIHKQGVGGVLIHRADIDAFLARGRQSLEPKVYPVAA